MANGEAADDLGLDDASDTGDDGYCPRRAGNSDEDVAAVEKSRRDSEYTPPPPNACELP